MTSIYMFEREYYISRSCVCSSGPLPSCDGHQPMHDAKNGIHAVVNGEIYDYDRISSKLSEQFHQFFLYLLFT